MITIPAPVTVPVPGSHRVAFIPAHIFFHEFPVENIGLLKEKAFLILIQERVGHDDLVEKIPGVLVSKRT